MNNKQTGGKLTVSLLLVITALIALLIMTVAECLAQLPLAITGPDYLALAQILINGIVVYYLGLTLHSIYNRRSSPLLITKLCLALLLSVGIDLFWDLGASFIASTLSNSNAAESTNPLFSIPINLSVTVRLVFALGLHPYFTHSKSAHSFLRDDEADLLEQNNNPKNKNTP